MLETVDAGGMSVCKFDLNGVTADGRGPPGGHSGFKHRQDRRRLARTGGRSHARLFFAFVIARRARTLLPQVREVVVARVAVGPDDIDALAGRHLHLDLNRFFPRIEWNRHWNSILTNQRSFKAGG